MLPIETTYTVFYSHVTALTDEQQQGRLKVLFVVEVHEPSAESNQKASACLLESKECTEHEYELC